MFISGQRSKSVVHNATHPHEQLRAMVPIGYGLEQLVMISQDKGTHVWLELSPHCFACLLTMLLLLLLLCCCCCDHQFTRVLICAVRIGEFSTSNARISYELCAAGSRETPPSCTQCSPGRYTSSPGAYSCSVRPRSTSQLAFVLCLFDMACVASISSYDSRVVWARPIIYRVPLHAVSAVRRCNTRADLYNARRASPIEPRVWTDYIDIGVNTYAEHEESTVCTACAPESEQPTTGSASCIFCPPLRYMAIPKNLDGMYTYTDRPTSYMPAISNHHYIIPHAHARDEPCMDGGV